MKYLTISFLRRKMEFIILFSLLAFSSAILFFIPRPAYALFGFSFNLSTLLATLISWISYIINSILGFFYAIASWFVMIALDLNKGILAPNNQLISVGWTIVRDVANLGFVIAIIVMAFVTILRFAEGAYGMKKLLPKLIAAAILVNFSLLIAGVVINFTQVLTDFFLEDKLGFGNYGGFVESVSSAFGPQRLLLTSPDPLPPSPEDLAGGGLTFTTATLTSIASLFFSAIFILISILVMLGLFIMLMLRYLHLTFLLIISPIVWLFWVIPDLSGQFSKWWNSFLRWAFFAPAVSFFIYLALLSAENLSQRVLHGSTNNPLAGLGGTLHGVVSQGGQMIVLAGIMFGGLIIAQQMGIAGAGAAIGLAKGAQNKVQAWAKTKAERGWDRTRARVLQSKPVQKMAGLMKGLPGLKRAGFALGAQANIVRQKQINDAEKAISKYSLSDLAKNIKNLREPEKVAALKMLAKNNMMTEIPAEDRLKLMSTKGKQRELFGKYGEGRAWEKEIQPAAGMDEKTADAIIAGEKDKAGEAMRKWSKTLLPDQIAKLPPELFNGNHAKLGFTKENFGGDEKKANEILQAVRAEFIHGITLNNPQAIARYFPKLNGIGQREFGEMVEKVSADMKKSTEPEDQRAVATAMVKMLDDTIQNLPSHILFASTFAVEGGSIARPKAEESRPTAKPS